MSYMDGSKGMSPRKAMASGSGESFGVGGWPGGEGRKLSPDHIAKTGEKGAMADAERGIGMPINHSKDHLPAQAAPDHGPGHHRALGFDHSDNV